MHYISVKGPELPLSKRGLAQEMTEVASEVFEIPKDKSMIYIVEFPEENTALGGTLLYAK